MLFHFRRLSINIVSGGTAKLIQDDTVVHVICVCSRGLEHLLSVQ